MVSRHYEPLDVVRLKSLLNEMSLSTDPLDNEDALMENLDMLANIARCKYQESASTVISIFEPIAASFEV
jgi:hypothetical protein